MGYSIWKDNEPAGGLRPIATEPTTELILDSGQIKKFVQQNSPVNNALARNYQGLNDLYEGDAGQLSLIPTEVTVRESKGTLPPVHTLCTFFYDADDVDLALVNSRGRYQISGYDRRVLNAVSTLWQNRRRTVSITEIYRLMNGYRRGNPSSSQLEAVSRSLYKLSRVQVKLDLTQEWNANMIRNPQPLVEAGILKDASDRVRSVELRDHLLNYREGTITSEKGVVFKSIQITSEPPLLTYNRLRKTLISIPMEYVGMQTVSATEKSIAMQDYLLMRIYTYKAGKLMQNRVLYETLYADSGEEMPTLSKDRIRDREMIGKMLDEWVKMGLLESWQEVKKGRSFIGIEFTVKEEAEEEEEGAEE